MRMGCGSNPALKLTHTHTYIQVHIWLEGKIELLLLDK